jgi:hypothetical protein
MRSLAADHRPAAASVSPRVHRRPRRSPLVGSLAAGEGVPRQGGAELSCGSGCRASGIRAHPTVQGLPGQPAAHTRNSTRDLPRRGRSGAEQDSRTSEAQAAHSAAPYVRQTSAQLQRPWRRATRIANRIGGSPMSVRKLSRSAVVLVALTGAAALLTVGIAGAQGEQQHASHGRSYHAAKASATAQPRPVAKAAGGACRLKSAPPSGTGSVSVNGHTVRVIPAGVASAGSAEAKAAPSGTGSVSVNGHAVRAVPAGTRCGRSAGGGTR